MRNDSPQASQPAPLLDRADVRVAHASGLGETLAAFGRRVRAGDPRLAAGWWPA